MIKQALPVLGLGCDLGEPYCGFRRLHLTKERTDAAEFVMPPMLQEPSGFRRDPPLIGIGQATPRVHVSTDFIDDRGGVVLLLLGRKPLSLVEYKSRLCSRFAFLRLWDRRDEFGTASALNGLLRGLPSFI